MTFSVKLVSVTAPKITEANTAEELVVYCARVSNPANQTNMETAPRLIKYLIDHNHWSPMEMVSACFEIKTSRAIAAQILRHRSFSFQEFSQRYAAANNVLVYPARSQDMKNRQNSIDNMGDNERNWFQDAQAKVINLSAELYKQALDKGIAKELARFLLPGATETTLYMSGTLRSWIHYLDVRCDPGTQLEHREIALEIKQQLSAEFPNVAQALNW